MDTAHANILIQMETQVTRLEKMMTKVIALLISTAVTVLLALGTALLNIGFG